MKKIGINLIIGTIISIVLIVISLLVIKPNYSYLMMDNNNNIWISTNGSTFSFNNEEISYKKEDDKITIEMNNSYSNKTDAKIIYMTSSTDYGKVLMAAEGFIVEGKRTYSETDTKHEHPIDTFTKADPDGITIYYKYIGLLEIRQIDNDKINVTTQKILCCILSIFIGYILSFLAYPVILYDKFKENKKLALICIPSTLILCISSAFYIYFTLK
jgi:hypothetical protein